MSGFVKLTLGGASYQMKPSYEAMRDIEARTNMTLSELQELVIMQRLKIEEAVLIVWYGCDAAGEGFDSIDGVGAAVFEERLTSKPLLKSLSQYCLNCLYAPAEAKKKFEEEVAPVLGITIEPNKAG